MYIYYDIYGNKLNSCVDVNKIFYGIQYKFEFVICYSLACADFYEYFQK